MLGPWQIDTEAKRLTSNYGDDDDDDDDGVDVDVDTQRRDVELRCDVSHNDSGGSTCSPAPASRSIPAASPSFRASAAQSSLAQRNVSSDRLEEEMTLLPAGAISPPSAKTSPTKLASPSSRMESIIRRSNSMNGPHNINNNNNNINNNNNLTNTKNFWKLVFGAAGIYGAYLWYGNLQEDMFRYEDENGARFTYAWFLHVLETCCNIAVASIGRCLCNNNTNNNNIAAPATNGRTWKTEPTENGKAWRKSPLKDANSVGSIGTHHQGNQHPTVPIPLFLFFKAGVTQALGKVLVSLSLAAGLSFPVCTLAKSAKIVPVMIGQMLLGGARYTPRQYLCALLVVAGTALLAVGEASDESAAAAAQQTDLLTPAGRLPVMQPTETTASSEQAAPANSRLGLMLIILSLVMDGATGGLQKRIKRVMAASPPSTYDFMFYTNLSMTIVAWSVSIWTGELTAGFDFLRANPKMTWMIVRTCLCSSIGQSFIFFVITVFDPLVCATITTTRQILSVLWSLLAKGHKLTDHGILGVSLAILGLLIETHRKASLAIHNNAATTKQQQQQQLQLVAVVRYSENGVHDQN